MLTEKEHKAVAEKIREEKTSSKKVTCLEPVYKRAYKTNLTPEQWVDIYKRLGELKCMKDIPLIHRKICVEVIENHHNPAELCRLAKSDEDFQWLKSYQGKPMCVRNIQLIFFSYFPEFQRKNRKFKPRKNADIRQEQTRIKREINQFICHRCGATNELEIHHMIPIDIGGTNDAGNLIILCHKCHLEATRYFMKMRKDEKL